MFLGIQRTKILTKDALLTPEEAARPCQVRSAGKSSPQQSATKWETEEGKEEIKSAPDMAYYKYLPIFTTCIS